MAVGNHRTFDAVPDRSVDLRVHWLGVPPIEIVPPSASERQSERALSARARGRPVTGLGRVQRSGSPALFTCDPYRCYGYENPKDGPPGVVSCWISYTG